MQITAIVNYRRKIHAQILGGTSNGALILLVTIKYLQIKKPYWIFINENHYYDSKYYSMRHVSLYLGKIQWVERFLECIQIKYFEPFSG